MGTDRNIRIGIVITALMTGAISLPACGADAGRPSVTEDSPAVTSDKSPVQDSVSDAQGSQTGSASDTTEGNAETAQPGYPGSQTDGTASDDMNTEPLTSQTLHSDGNRVVLHSTDSSDPTYIILTYSGTDVTGLYTCIEHGSTEAAQGELSTIVPNEGEGTRAVFVDGTCLVIEHTPEAYSGLTLANLSEAYPGMIWV